MLGAKKGQFALYQREGSKTWYIGTIRRSTGTTDKREAMKRRDDIIADIRSGKWHKAQKYEKFSFADLAERFMNEHAPKKAKKTQKFYKDRFAYLMPFFSDYKLSEIDRDLVYRYQVKRRKEGATTTLNRELSVLSKMFNLAVDTWEWMEKNPCKGIERDKEDKDGSGEPLTQSEELMLLQAAEKKLSGNLPALILMGIYTGIRSNQIINMKWDAIDFENNEIRAFNEKTKQHYYVPIVPVLRAALLQKHYDGAEGLVFRNKKGKLYDEKAWYRSMTVISERAGIGHRHPHDLRHTTGTRLAELGFTAHEIAAILDHSQLSTTKRYIKHNRESRKRIMSKFGLSCTQPTQIQ